MAVCHELTHHNFGVNQVLRAAETYKSDFQGGTELRIAFEGGWIDSYLNGYNEEVTYTVSEAKNRLPELIKRAEAGEPVTITKRGIPVVEIVRKAEDVRPKRVFGVLGDKKVVIDPDWARP